MTGLADSTAASLRLAPGEPAARADVQHLRVPVLADRLVAGTPQVDLGQLRVHKRVETAEATVHRTLARDDLEVERVPVNRPLNAPATPRTDSEWLAIPVMEEVLVSAHAARAQGGGARPHAPGGSGAGGA